MYTVFLVNSRQYPIYIIVVSLSDNMRPAVIILSVTTYNTTLTMRRMRKLTSHMLISSSKSSQNAIKNQFTSNQKQMMSSTLNEEKEQKSVLIEEISGNYLITLNRPKALNSLNMDMINILTPFYQKLISEKKPCTVVMRGEGGKAFCAGGDV